MNIKKLLIVLSIVVVTVIYKIFSFNNIELPIVAIANYGPHSSLNAAITGLQEELEENGFIEGKNIKYEIADVGFDLSLIPQMITKLKSSNPKVMVVLSTPIAQFAKNTINNIALIYSAITDPVEAGLIEQYNKPTNNVSGSADKQNLKVLLEFARKLIPNAKRVGLLYSISESNDIALVNMMQDVAKTMNMSVVAIPVEQARDVPMRMQGFKDKVDFIYVGTSGAIQPTLPVIAAESNKMGIPVLNAEEEAVKNGLVLASFGVNYKSVGHNTGKLVVEILNGKDIKTLDPIYPKAIDHHGYISKKKATELGLAVPAELQNVKIVE